jgi:four helix bundle protein
MKINRFEEIEVWQLSRIFVKEIYQITNISPFSKDFGLRDQLRRASISIMSNISEGFERKGKKEFVHFLYLSKGSAAEIRSQLYAAFDLGYIDKNIFEKLFNEIELISKSLSGFIKYLINNQKLYS